VAVPSSSAVVKEEKPFTPPSFNPEKMNRNECQLKYLAALHTNNIASFLHTTITTPENDVLFHTLCLKLYKTLQGVAVMPFFIMLQPLSYFLFEALQ